MNFPDPEKQKLAQNLLGLIQKQEEKAKGSPYKGYLKRSKKPMPQLDIPDMDKAGYMMESIVRKNTQLVTVKPEEPQPAPQPATAPKKTTTAELKEGLRVLAVSYTPGQKDSRFFHYAMYYGTTNGIHKIVTNKGQTLYVHNSPSKTWRLQEIKTYPHFRYVCGPKNLFERFQNYFRCFLRDDDDTE